MPSASHRVAKHPKNGPRLCQGAETFPRERTDSDPRASNLRLSAHNVLVVSVSARAGAGVWGSSPALRTPWRWSRAPARPSCRRAPRGSGRAACRSWLLPSKKGSRGAGGASRPPRAPRAPRRREPRGPEWGCARRRSERSAARRRRRSWGSDVVPKPKFLVLHHFNFIIFIIRKSS